MLAFWAVGRFQARHLLSLDEVAPAFTLRGLDSQSAGYTTALAYLLRLL